MATKYSNNSNIVSSMQVNKQTNKQRKNYKSFFLLSTGPAQCSEKTLMALSMSAKTLKTLNCLPEIFFYMDIMNLMFTALSLHSFSKLISKCYKSITIKSDYGKP